MDILKDFLIILLPVVSSIAGWLVGKRKQNNDFLGDLQGSIDLLSKKNSELLSELVGVKTQNTDLLVGINYLKHEVDKVRKENAHLRVEIQLVRNENTSLSKQVEDLNVRLEGIKTITRK